MKDIKQLNYNFPPGGHTVFRENNSPLQPEIFNTATYVNPRTRAMLEKSRAPLYYEHFFYKIDEKMFAPLFMGFCTRII